MSLPIIFVRLSKEEVETILATRRQCNNQVPQLHQQYDAPPYAQGLYIDTTFLPSIVQQRVRAIPDAIESRSKCYDDTDKADEADTAEKADKTIKDEKSEDSGHESEEAIFLPEDYIPTDYDVTGGRGKGSYNLPGNRRFRSIIDEHLTEYVACRTKFEKGAVVSKIVCAVKEQDNGKAKFIRFDRKLKRWMELEPISVREKVGHSIREGVCGEFVEKRKRNALAKRLLNKKQKSSRV